MIHRDMTTTWHESLAVNIVIVLQVLTHQHDSSERRKLRWEKRTLNSAEVLQGGGSTL